jgi:hypothetical protein
VPRSFWPRISTKKAREVEVRLLAVARKSFTSASSSSSWPVASWCFPGPNSFAMQLASFVATSRSFVFPVAAS